ncbi:FtsW/RodA/SpoVE family cell cycle protein [Ornithinimicrobium faecis]|uniref:Probable peptidoglycan glycosyltransferase FtsW n=1 Tax=Ornithinimicrobium faecis TaxID=2934158 RepID=A0ABY4YY78_9MICO|nr:MULTISPECIES: putative peptidoglycan glycosyltransferase FtsW [unclassified Ornithinimicrobium]USQ81484.1 putative lipid II flippase FtsW [Ornithinimicrobium sp. HY1793]
MTTWPIRRDEQGRESVAAGIGERLRSPVAPYYLLLTATGLLVSIGLVMVLSASSVGSYQSSGNSYKVFLNQLMFAGMGIVLGLIASRIPVRVWKWLAPWGMLGAIGLQALVFSPLGTDFQGNRNWISLAGFTLQPSEFGKVALVVFGAAVLTKKRKVLGRISHVLIPFVFPGAFLLIGLVLAGHDLGTVLILVAITGGMMFGAGVQARYFVAVAGLAAAGAAYMAVGSANRMERIQAWIGNICVNPDVQGCFQKVHAEYALADGGWWGLGLGGSKEKWGLLPEPHNDFILAIIGEELGLPGTLTVMLLFVVIAYACYRIVVTSTDFFVRIAAVGIMVWLVAQAMLNIGSVIGMLPIIGVPLPLVSSGGSALIAALIGMGILLSLARSLPGAKASLGSKPSLLRRTLAVVPAPRLRRR